MQRTVRHALVGLLLLTLTTTVVPFLAIQTVVPDVLLIWIVYLALREGQITSTIAGFGVGLIVDLLSGDDGMLGVTALSKTVAGFLAGYFYNESRTMQSLGGYRFVVVTGIVSVVHSAVYFVIFLQGTDISWWEVSFRYILPIATFTAVLSALPMFVFARRHLS